MADQTPEDGPLVRVITGDQQNTLLAQSRRYGRATGLAIAYREIYIHLVRELDEADTELLRTPDNQVVLGTIIALSRLVKHYTGIPERYAQKALRQRQELARQALDLGMIDSHNYESIMAETERDALER